MLYRLWGWAKQNTTFALLVGGLVLLGLSGVYAYIIDYLMGTSRIDSKPLLMEFVVADFAIEASGGVAFVAFIMICCAVSRLARGVR